MQASNHPLSRRDHRLKPKPLMGARQELMAVLAPGIGGGCDRDSQFDDGATPICGFPCMCSSRKTH